MHRRKRRFATIILSGYSVLALSTAPCVALAPSAPPLRAPIRRLSSPELSTRMRAATAIAKMGRSASSAAPVLIRMAATTHRLDGAWKCETDALVNMGASATPALAQALQSRDSRRRFFAAYIMGRIAIDPGGRLLSGASSVTPYLERALRDPNAGVRSLAASSLARVRARSRV